MRTVGIAALRIVLLDTISSGLFEADHVRALTQAGYKLLIASAGNAKVSKDLGQLIARPEQGCGAHS